MTAGYYRFPTIYQDKIVFVSEDDLWQVSSAGGVARRLTSNSATVTYPMFSPDGSQIAFVGREEGNAEVYVMEAEGGRARRLTYQSADCRVVGWNAAGTHILFCSNYGQPHAADYVLYEVAADETGGRIEMLPFGPTRTISFGPGGRVVLGRNTGDPARWKRYRGGTAGQLWIDHNADGDFVRFLPDLAGNIASPMWILRGSDEGRIYFIGDHEGIGNLYSARPDGSDLQRHTDHDDYYIRNPATDGERIVYHAGADLYVYTIDSGESRLVPIDCFSPRVQRNRKFVHSGHYLDSAALNPKGSALALTARGKAFTFHNHEGAVIQLGKANGVRYRLADWLNDGKRIALISDEPGEEVLEIHSREPGVAVHRLAGIEFGRAVDLRVSPTADKIALTNHRHDLLLIDLEAETATLVDRSPHRRIAGLDWSPDGRWIVYGFGVTHQTTELRLYRLPDPEAEDETLHTDAIHRITRPVLHDTEPAFDPDGRYIYFISHREFNPVYDSLHFDLGFPRGSKPYLITLRADLPNPFIPRPDEDEEEPEEEAGEDEESDASAEDDDAEYSGVEDADDEDDDAEFDLDEFEEEEFKRLWKRLIRRRMEIDPSAHSKDGEKAAGTKGANAVEGKTENDEKKAPPPVTIDLDNIAGRVLAFPVPEGRYGEIAGIPDKAIFTIFPVRGSLGEDDTGSDEGECGQLRAYDFKDYRAETLVDEVDWFDLSRNRKKLLYGSGDRLRVIAAGEKAPGNSGGPRKSGWIDLGRVKLSIDPQSEWEQMFREAWRLQRDHYWTEDMSDVDWQTVYTRYFPLIGRISSRGEFSDLMWEMQGELGTSHAYEFGGDYRPRPIYSQGFLAADFRWDAEAGGYRLDHFVHGDSWNAQAHSPLAAPGVDIHPGDVLVAINGQPLSAEVSPAQLLVNQAGEEVLLTIKRRGEEKARERGSEEEKEGEGASPLRMVTVTTLFDERTARYRAWINGNRARVHEATGGRVGYVHIPDMGPQGYAEFHRGYLAEVEKEALIVEVRYNGGGHVSALILEKLARRRLGYDIQRWGDVQPYPSESVAGPLVALTNEHAGSDGDIFCHSFKLMGLGPLLGKRTWGGVVGIWPRHALVDGTVTTQPEFSYWFRDVGWNVENYGTDPDVEVDNTPQDYRAGRDAQLEAAIAAILERLRSNPPLQPPDPKSRPSRALPKLPPRKRDD
ncbi:MAG: PDZ domain-containing protein [Caldilineaceae bacterium]|nr:PDZ domain-containing protein [Caldilineaceae bacterium]